MEIDFSFRPNEGLPLSAHAKLREAGPVIWSDALNSWVVSSHKSVRTVLSDVSRFTNAGTPVASQLGAESMLIDDTPLHHAMRAVWTQASSRAALLARAAELEANAARVIEPVRPRLDAGETIDLLPLLQQFGTAFIGSSFDVSQERLAVFQHWAQMAADAPAMELAEGSEAHARHSAVRAELFDLIHLEIEDRRERFARGESPQDLISLMVAAEGMHGITRTKVADNIFNFIIGSMDTTEKWIGSIIVRLCTTPELLAQVRADPALLPRVMDEVMRVDTVAQILIRRVKAGGAELEGQMLKEGDSVMVMLGAANSDPAEYENPTLFDPDRPAKPNIGFGFGFHHCLGINIARQQATAFITILLNGFPDLRIVGTDYGTSWALWGPRRIDVARG